MLVEKLPEVSRATLQGAIEAGIALAQQHPKFTPEAARRLREVGERATVVGIGIYAEIGNGSTVTCPVAAAYPDFRGLKWDHVFCVGFDGAMRDAGVSGRFKGARISNGERGLSG